MITLRKSEDRGHSDNGWLKAYQTFSFANYLDPAHMGFRSLRVLNDDVIAPGRGFGAHGHRDMEIVTYMLSGRLAHKDSLGQAREITTNMIQSMSAGTGVIHSEFNASKVEPSHSLQIWIVPDKEDVKPAYQEIAYAAEEKAGRFRLIASPQENPKEPAAFIHQDAWMYASVLKVDQPLEHVVKDGRSVWVHCATGNITLNGHAMKEGDGAAVTKEKALQFAGAGAAGGEFLLFDLA